MQEESQMAGQKEGVGDWYGGVSETAIKSGSVHVSVPICPAWLVTKLLPRQT